MALVVSGPQDFSLAATPPSQTVTPGQSTTFGVTVTRSGGFADAITFGVTGLPAGVSSGFAPASTTGNSSTLTLTTTAAVTPGTYALTVTGTAGALTRSAAVSLVVEAASGGGFTLAVAPATRTIARGATTTFSIAINRAGGYTGPVSFTVSGLPASGATGTFITSSPTSSTAVLRVVTDAGVASGSYVLTIRGSGGGTTQTATATLNIAP